jgi:hypothetical protein
VAERADQAVGLIRNPDRAAAVHGHRQHLSRRIRAGVSAETPGAIAYGVIDVRAGRIRTGQTKREDRTEFLQDDAV